jgi:hypothetical protein
MREDDRRALAEHHAAGGVLTASGDAPTAGLRQTVSIHKLRTGVRVHVETYLPTEWDNEVESFEVELADLDAALSWLESARGVRWSHLSLQPLRPRPARQP